MTCVTKKAQAKNNTNKNIKKECISDFAIIPDNDAPPPSLKVEVCTFLSTSMVSIPASGLL